MSDTIYLSLGSNLGDKESNIASCIAMLGSYVENTEIRTSSFYLSEPLYNINQPSFLNIIVELKTSIKKDIDHLTKDFPFKEIRFSKYCNGIEILQNN